MSDLPGAYMFNGETPQSWHAALQLLAAALPQDSPSVIVLDELPYLIQSDPTIEGVLQKLFDREFSRRPVLLLLIGSDLSVMEAINTYDRPFYMRATDLAIPPLTPADLADRLSLRAADAFDAHLVSGGLPMVCEEWPEGASLEEYLREVATDPTSPLIVNGERVVAAEFPPDAKARLILDGIGSGQRTFSGIMRAVPEVPRASLVRALQLLTEKRMVTASLPISMRPSKESRYHVTDSFLKFWLSFLGPYITEVERGRGDLVMSRIRRSWAAWRGTTIEPLIRESLRRMDGLPEGTGAIGGYWTRTNHPEIDIVGADREPIAKKITMVGSVKWLESRPFDDHDLRELVVHQSQLPGASQSVPLYAVSRSGCVADGVHHITPENLLDAWRA